MSKNPAEANAAFAAFCPELKSKYAVYPFPAQYRALWLKPSTTEKFQGKPIVMLSSQDRGLQEDYNYCKVGPLGKGYYHILTKVAHVNLYNRLSSEGSGASCCSSVDRKRVEQWDICETILHTRSLSNRSDDSFAEKSVLKAAQGYASAHLLH
mmetsp:Transcript_25213/g.41881  ORF Transcript_25213/g.41881 Transcript_25213/m.41881 type:complete len:153 (+) Transcript_25213:245-703(+)|eukprot:CAMPEP_0119008400 /NCGR_PEP_ID=MMETSP1176-20130426/3665_1 /TAXON_ID=265551 /ORGANISM="Synedropsis recta cf, Strain CCMP1620" /LENGTH=152 /DNA_ID=CAMNT_0006960719 /DNA_START=235 /DNA_END=693 /DNA_ORIENTATION=-